MKKFIISLMALVASCACFVACGGGNDDSSSSAPVESTSSADASSEEASSEESSAGETVDHAAALETVKETIHGQYVQSEYNYAAVDYTLMGEIFSWDLEEKVSVDWSVDVTEGVTVTKVGTEWKVDVNELAATDIPYVLTATITDSDGCTTSFTLERTVKGNPVMSIAEALAAEDNTDIKVAGTVMTINTVWSEQYSNISVTIIDDKGDQLYVYRLGTKVEVGDIIVVEGKMATYNDKRQVAQGGLASIIGSNPAYAYTEMTIAEALTKPDNTNVIVTGTVVNIGTAYDAGYNNMSVTIEDKAGDQIYLYRLTGEVALGNVIKVKGSIATHYDNRQITGGTYELIEVGTPPVGGDSSVENSSEEESSEGNVGGEVEGTLVASIDMMGATNKASVTADKSIYEANGITYQNDKASSRNDCYDNTGTFSARAYQGSTITITSTTAFNCVVFTLDDYTVEGKSYLAGLDGTTIEGATISRSNDVLTILFASNVTTFTTEELKSQIRIEKIELFVGVVAGDSSADDSSEEESSEDTTVEATVEHITAAPQEGYTYIFHVYQKTNQQELYFAGSMNGYYFATTESANEAVELQVEYVDDTLFNVFFMDGTTKKYIGMRASGTHNNVVIDTEPVSQFYWSEEYQTIITNIVAKDGQNTDFFLGNYNNYVTISGSYTSYIAEGNNVGGLVEVGQPIVPPENSSEEVSSETPVVPEDSSEEISSEEVSSEEISSEEVSSEEVSSEEISSEEVSSEEESSKEESSEVALIGSLDMMGATNKVSVTADKSIYEANGITYQNDKANSSTACFDNTGTYSARAYVGSTITVSCTTAFTKVVITLDDYSSGKYLVGFDAVTIEGATITRDNDVVTITFNSAVTSFTTSNLVKQARIEKIEIYG